jgi:hypothetical protein
MWIVLLSSIILAQDGVVRTSTGVDLKLTGELTLYYLFRDGSLLEFENAVNAGIAPAASQRSADLVGGRARLRLDIRYDQVSGVIEIETRNIDQGTFQGFGRDTADEVQIAVEQAFIRVRDFLADDVTLFLGIRDVRAVTRAWGEPFFLDVAESESAFNRFAMRGLRNFVHRDTLEPAGVLVRYDPMGPVRIEAFAYRVFDNLGGAAAGGGDRVDENLFGIYVDWFAHPEYTKGFLIVTDFQGGGDPTRPAAFNDQAGKNSDVVTVGGGVDLFFGEGKPFEAFAEGYGQFGRLTRGVNKSAYAFRAGARAVWLLDLHSWFIQAAIWEASGDSDPANGTDETFQSYENEDVLAILQSNDYGIDIDTNYRGFVVTAGILGWERFDISIDWGAARFVHRPRNDAGARYAPHELGHEIDIDVRWQYTPEFALFLTAAFLFDSSAMHRMSSNGSRESWLLVIGGNFRY